MIPLREDGKIDAKFVEILPFDDFEEVVEEMNWDQIDYIFSLAKPIEGMIEPLKVDYSIDDSYDWGWGIDSDKILMRMNGKIKTKKC